MEWTKHRGRLALERFVMAVRQQRVAVLALVLMCGQNTTHTLLIRHSRGVRQDGYAPSTNVLLVEVVKFLLCAAVMARSARRSGSDMLPVTSGDGAGHGGLLAMYTQSLRRSWKVCVPACIYFFQNILAFVALQNLEAGVFAVLSQLKTLTTAVFSVAILGKRLSPNQWRALCLLVLAAVLIESPPPPAPSCLVDDAPLAPPQHRANNALGVAAVLGIATLSGFAGVYFERILKSSEATLWERNFQLSAYSIVFAVINIALFDRDKVWENGFFGGYSWAAAAIVFTSAAGGILVAVVVKYTDNIVKSFATAIAICLTSLLSIPLLGASLNRVFWVGALMVVLSIFNYSSSLAPPSLPPLPTVAEKKASV